MNIKRIITSVLLLSSTASYAQSFAPEDYIYPVEGAAKLFSANFGELRSDHFHSGVDIKTDGVEGKRIVAVADGYISRISLSPYGYGLALYITHNSGSTSVYGHLSRFRDDVAKYVEAERYRTKSHSVNLFCNSQTFVVKQGDLIAYSGNSGSSAGPHLHFEVRETASQKPINVIADRIIEPRDNIAPLIRTLHYIEVDTLQGIPHNAPRRSYDVEKVGESYQISGGAKVEVGRRGYFVLEATDRRNDVTNTFGIYRLSASIDGKQYFQYSMDGFTYDKSRYCNAIGYYPIMINTRNEPLRLAATENCDMSHYIKIHNKGLVTASQGVVREVSIDVEDDCGNTSNLNFMIVGKSDDRCFVAERVEPNMVASAKSQYIFRGDGVAVSIPAYALYESVEFKCEEVVVDDAKALSKGYKILDVTTPLHKAMSVSIKADIALDLRNKVGLSMIGRTGKVSFIRGEYVAGVVTANSRNAGTFYVATDTTAPTISLGIAEGSQQGGSSYFTCAVSDDLSGVSSYSATIDGEWIAFNLVNGRLRHNFRSKPDGEQHELVVTVVDNVGNSTTVTCRYMR
ncbi:MAG: M23 family metallopeptidase [Rikenellaceae bacterium]